MSLSEAEDVCDLCINSRIYSQYSVCGFEIIVVEMNLMLATHMSFNE